MILDALNFVKGYRYELWCLARAAGTKCCVLWVDTPLETCRQWNTARCREQVRSSSRITYAYVMHPLIHLDILALVMCLVLSAHV